MMHGTMRLKKKPTRCDLVVEFIIPMFPNCSTCFGRHTAHHQELKNCNCSLWFYIRFWLPVAATMAQPSQRPVRIPPGAWIFVCCECRVLSGRGLCDELITRPEESYRLWCVVVCDLETPRIGAPYIYIYIYMTFNSLRVNTSAHCSGRKQVKG